MDVQNDENFKLNFNDEIEKNNFVNLYTKQYRILKTILLSFVWASIGYNSELFGSTLEDLKILLGVNYVYITQIGIIKSVGYLIWLSVIGIVCERLLNRLNVVVAISTFIFGLTSLVVPFVKIYWITAVAFLIQGICHATFDVAGNELVLNLWKGISDSPINVVFGGFCVGGGIAASIVNSFIKATHQEDELIIDFNQTNSYNNITTKVPINYTNETNSNYSKTITADDITLHVPYTVGTVIASVSTIILVVMHFFEKKTIKLTKSNNRTPAITKHRKDENSFLTKIHYFLFNEAYNKELFFLQLIQLGLIAILCMNIGSIYSIIGIFQFTYAIKGPAKLATSTALNIKTLFWFGLFISQLLVAKITFRMNKMLFFSILCFMSIIVFVLYAIPGLNSTKLFHWLIILPISFSTGPYLPGVIMMKNCLFVNANTIVLSLIFSFTIIGGIGSQYLIGYILVHHEPDQHWLGYTDATSIYTIPLLVFLFVICLSLTFVFITIVYWKFNRVKQACINHN